MKIEQEIRLKKKKRWVKLYSVNRYSSKCWLSSTTTYIATTTSTSSITSLSFTRHDSFVRYSSWAFSLFIFIRKPSGFGLAFTDLPQIIPYSSGSKRVRFWRSTMLHVSRSELSDERLKATPRMPKCAGTWAWWLRVAEVWAPTEMDLGFFELVPVPGIWKSLVPLINPYKESRFGVL